MIRVLLIDDEPGDRALVLRELQRAFGAREIVPSEITDGDAFAEALRGEPPGLVITDFRLRWTDGHRVLDDVKRCWPDCPVLMFTDSGSEEVAVAAMKAGLDDYILKSPGHFVRLATSARSALDRTRARRAAADLSERLEGLLNQLNVGIYRTDPEGRVLEANPAYLRIMGFASVDEACGASLFSRIVSPEEAERLAEQLRKRGVLRDEELAIWRKDEDIAWVEISATPTTTPDGRGAVDGILEDVTERKRAEALLHERDERLDQSRRLEAMGRLAGGVAHDFNNLLTAITIYTELAQSSLEATEPATAHLEQIHRTADQAAGLVNQLLAFARRQVIQPRAMDLNRAVAWVEPMLSRVIDEDIEIRLELDPDLLPVEADPGLIEQVLVNLALNARDAMPTGGHLTIATANLELDAAAARSHAGLEPGSYGELRIADTGVGMDPEVLAHVFEPFYTTKEKGSGTGLGLAMVHGIVAQSDGAIEVQSRIEDGTTFRVYLPRADRGVDETAAPTPVVESLGGDETLLVVEDDEIVRGVVVSVLEQHGYRVLSAARGEEAVMLAEGAQEDVRLLLSDVVMPGIGIHELIERVRDRHLELKVLLTSGYTEDSMLRRGIIEGEMVFLPKPFSAMALLRAVRASLDS